MKELQEFFAALGEAGRSLLQLGCAFVLLGLGILASIILMGLVVGMSG